ncbi:hypothetical protein [Wenjunlia vitaminophila]|uniref:hypothetical protein n=1 Tax=Wenjunlia vitaminophila TaxID=76728 RepID=UPI0003A3E7FD|nr:hypothetical protein [Wenjunlia vitaminophila]
MDDDAEQQLSSHFQDTQVIAAQAVNPGYALGELARALTTARGHRSEPARARAEKRAERWRAVLSGMADGRLDIGSRTPVAGLPAWVTPEVVRGGFATGQPVAGGPLQPYETEAARRHRLPATRAALFAHYLTEPGLTELCGLLDSGCYRVTVPEEAALLTVAWLVRARDVDAAVELVTTLEPFADRLRFLPQPADQPPPDLTAVYRRSAKDAGAVLAARQPNSAVEAQREALTVWQPFADELLVHWLETAVRGRVLETAPDPDWHRRGADLLNRYRRLAATHASCGKHRNPRENLGILRGALEETVAGRPLSPRQRGLLVHAVDSMVRRRGRPGSDRHTALRRRQAAQGALPSYHAIAQLVMRRLSAVPQDMGVADVAPLVAPVSPEEQAETGLPAGTRIPPVLRRVVEAALSAPIGTLVERGVVPSAEVLAELVPQLVAGATADSYPDPALRALVAANYCAFRNRRSLLLLNLAKQVRVNELPWARAASGHRDRTKRNVPLAVLGQVGELAVQAFPGTLLPNPLVRELGELSRAAGLELPLVEELAADIFMGTFSRKFLDAARVAALVLTGTLYERYYGIDYAAVRALATDPGSGDRGSRHAAPEFARLCVELAGAASGSRSPRGFNGVARNGTVIEQSQILTTHNLATLVHDVGITPEPGWDDLARRCFGTVCRLVDLVSVQPRPLRVIKDAAYAWRQMLFHLSLCTPAEEASVLAWMEEEVARYRPDVGIRLGPALAGLRLVAAGGEFDSGGTADNARARRFLGWTTGRHWLLDAA